MFFYYLLLACSLLLIGPILLLEKKRRAGICQKLGFIPKAIAAELKLHNGPCIWIHSVSVGEFNAAYPLIKELISRHQDWLIIVSTTTQTGQQLASAKLKDQVLTIYFPFDLPLCFNPWLKAIKPDLAVIVETEIWPGFVHACHKLSIPIVMANARMSLRSSKRYQKLKVFFAPVLQQFSALLVQSQSEAERFQQVGGLALPIQVLGNLKYDGFEPASKLESENLRSSLNLAPKQPVIVAGSTHQGEESALLDALKDIQGQEKSPSSPRLILAPRHPDRYDAVADLITKAGFRVRRFSRQETFDTANDVYLLDTLGQLFKYYSLSTVAFVGGTLVPVGGHNLLEPYAYSTPVVCGPHLFKTSDVAQSLNKLSALTIVQSTKELVPALKHFLESPAKRNLAGQQGHNWLTQSLGAVNRTARALEELVVHKQSNILRQEPISTGKTEL